MSNSNYASAVWPVLAVVIVASGCDGGGAGGSGDPAAEGSSTGVAVTTDEMPTGTDGGEVGSTAVVDAEIVVDEVVPAVVDPDGGSWLEVRGAGFAGGVSVQVGGVEVGVEVVADDLLRVTSPPLDGVSADVVVSRGEQEVVWSALEVWSPLAIPGARVFDAGHGVATSGAGETFEWQRLTASIGDDWRVRDGNTLTWLPSRGRFVMVGGWNGEMVPDGFSTVGPDVYPPENTTDEVWSSADGVTWSLDLAHQNGQFERRHAHNTVLWQGSLWMIGGDHHQGFYNHDVVTSGDGLTWEVVLGPGTTRPPWSERALQISGVYAGKLWTGGGQDAVGEVDLQVIHNDLWSSEDGVTWQQVAADGPASDTRWGGCGSVDGFVEFKGRMWLVGCARHRDDVEGHTLYNEVWSTTDGVAWTKHAEPPWKGKIWHNVVVWQGHLWAMFGFTYGDPDNGLVVGNANEVWYSPDGETWKALPFDAPVPGSHAQGVAVTEDALVYAGGNYSFGNGGAIDKSAWRLVPARGDEVDAWADRGGLGMTVRRPVDAAAPLLVADAFGVGRAGLHFDGSTAIFALAGDDDVEVTDLAEDGFSVFWVARAPYSPPPYGWTENYNPASTVVGGTWPPSASVGFTDGALSYVNRAVNDPPTWDVVHVGADLQAGPGSVHAVGFTHAVDGTLTGFVDGVGEVAASTDYAEARGWSRIGGGLDGPGEGVTNRFAGTLGAVVIVPEVVEEEDAARLHAWARGRFGAP